MNEVSKWIVSGAEVREGLRLLSIYAPNRHLEAIVTADPKRFAGLLKKKLLQFADMVPVEDVKPARRAVSFREEWPFLSDPKCPPELKVLAADKITAYHNYIEGHEELFSCTSLESCFETAKKVIKNFSENRKILSEFRFFAEHGKCLGKHGIFAESRRIADLRALPISQLFRKQKNLEGSIWRIGNEISKGTKPHLLAEREERMESKRRELAEVNRMIEDFEHHR